MSNRGEPPLGGPDLLAVLARWIGETRVDDAARARARGRWLRQLASEETSFASVLADLAERGRPVLIHTHADRRHRGTIAALGVDFVAIEADNGTLVLITMGAIAAVRTEPHEGPAASARVVHLEIELGHALTELAAERPRVAVTTGPAHHVAGALRAVGRDMLTLRLDGDTQALLYVPLAAITEIICTGT